MNNRPLIALVLLAVILPLAVQARLGVGVAAGKIMIDEELKPGGIYGLPPVPVLNTGDESSSYGFSIQYHEQQPERRPPADWFRLEPDTFPLEPGQVQQVEIRLQIPIDATPGNYFAFLEAHPVATSESGETEIGIAAATKLHFSVAPATVWQALYYRIISLLNQYKPWSYIAIAVISTLVVMIMFRRFFTLRLSVVRRNNT